MPNIPSPDEVRHALNTLGINATQWREAKLSDERPYASDPTSQRFRLYHQSTARQFLKKWTSFKTYGAFYRGGMKAVRMTWEQERQAQMTVVNHLYRERDRLFEQQRQARAAQQQSDANAANTNNSTPKRGNSGASVTTPSRYAVSSPPKLPPTATDFAKKLVKVGVVAASCVVIPPPIGGIILKGLSIIGKAVSKALANVELDLKPNGSVSCRPEFIKSLKTDEERDDLAKMMISAHKATRQEGDRSPIQIRCKDRKMREAMHRQLSAQGYTIAPSQQALRAQQKQLQQQQAANNAKQQSQQQNNSSPQYNR